MTNKPSLMPSYKVYQYVHVHVIFLQQINCDKKYTLCSQSDASLKLKITTTYHPQPDVYLPFFLTDNDNYFRFDDTQLKKAPIKKYLHATPQQMYIPIVPQIVRFGLVNSL